MDLVLLVCKMSFTVAVTLSFKRRSRLGLGKITGGGGGVGGEGGGVVPRCEKADLIMEESPI